jgi:hypothetical protein
MGFFFFGVFREAKGSRSADASKNADLVPEPRGRTPRGGGRLLLRRGRYPSIRTRGMLVTFKTLDQRHMHLLPIVEKGLKLIQPRELELEVLDGKFDHRRRYLQSLRIRIA